MFEPKMRGINIHIAHSQLLFQTYNCTLQLFHCILLRTCSNGCHKIGRQQRNFLKFRDCRGNVLHSTYGRHGIGNTAGWDMAIGILVCTTVFNIYILPLKLKYND
jgi:hypothetical protein